MLSTADSLRRMATIAAVVPAYNEEVWIREALTSIVGQTDPPDEIIVVDDGSTDGTVREVSAFGDAVRLVHQENAGCPQAFNTGFAHATSDFVALCPADDVWEPQKLEWQREILRANPDVDVLFGAARAFGPRQVELEEFDFNGAIATDELRRTLFERNVIPDPSAVIRRELHERLDGYRADLSGGEDYEFWFRALRAGARFYADPRVVVSLRQHGGNLSAQAARVWEVRRAVHREYGPDLRDPALVRRVVADDLLRLGRTQLGLDRVADARTSYRESLRTRRSATAVAALAALSLPGSERAFKELNRRRRG